jgi:two-component system OmpR family response regulator
MRADLAGRRVDLTPTEFQLLATLAAQPGRIFTRSQLLDAVHGVAFESYERAIDTHIKNIRRKLEPDPRAPVHVLTVYGVGYRFSDDGT